MKDSNRFHSCRVIKAVVCEQSRNHMPVHVQGFHELVETSCSTNVPMISCTRFSDSHSLDVHMGTLCQYLHTIMCCVFVYSILLDKRYRASCTPARFSYPSPNRYETILKQRHVQVCVFLVLVN